MRTRHRRPGFTLIELMVSVALLSIIVVMVSQIFKISTEAAGRVNQQSELFSAAAAFREQVTDLLSKMEPGLLIIESPPPTTVRAEVPGGDALFRLRHDRLVFIASGGPGEFESVTDPTRGIPAAIPPLDSNSTPATSAQALIYLGPAIPLNAAGQPRYPANQLYDGSAVTPDLTLTASEWVLGRRALLLGIDPQTSQQLFLNNPGLLFGVADGAQQRTISDIVTAGGVVRNPVPDEFRFGVLDLIGEDATGAANASTLIARLDAVNVFSGGLLTGWNLAPLWFAHLAPSAATLGNPALPDPANDVNYYVRSGFDLLTHAADLRIEWTDGRRIDPWGPDDNPNTVADNDLRTRWFGLKPDRDSSPASVQYRSHMRRFTDAQTDNPNPCGDPDCNPDNPANETAAFSSIEWSPNDTTAGPNSRYRAIWRTDTWQFRPKALRFTFRVYDRLDRFSQVTTVDLNEDGTPDDLDGDSKPDAIRRYGQEFSIVVPLPG